VVVLVVIPPIKVVAVEQVAQQQVLVLYLEFLTQALLVLHLATFLTQVVVVVQVVQAVLVFQLAVAVEMLL
jgi:hypothetical protein